MEATLGMDTVVVKGIWRFGADERLRDIEVRRVVENTAVLRAAPHRKRR
jgi:hypothetical protein